ncbi:MAG: phosphoethanolamine transferase, partial [Enterobacter asburiae]|nr:phosphoethanolamine transferase [Enterobacter asburiae]
MNVTLIDTVVTRSRALSPWTGFYFLQSLLINFALGYPFSLLYAVAFTCVLHVLWRTAPRVQKALIGICSLVAALYFPFGQAYGSPNFNTLLALHSTNMEESTEILTIFPWYSYVVGIFIFALGVIAIRRQSGEKKSWGKIEILCLVFSVAVAFVAPIQNIPWDGKLRL